MLSNGAHDPLKLWKVIMFHFKNIRPIRLYFNEENDRYFPDLQKLLGDCFERDQLMLRNADCVMLIDTDGRFRIDKKFNDIFDLFQFKEVSTVIANRFPSRKNLVSSLILKTQETKRSLFLSQLLSLAASFLFLVRYGQFHQDPFSGLLVVSFDIWNKSGRLDYIGTYKYVLQNNVDIYAVNINFVRSEGSRLSRRKIFKFLKLLS